jgi:hypothetical protein
VTPRAEWAMHRGKPRSTPLSWCGSCTPSPPMPEPSRTRSDPELPAPEREWLVTNGLGGYASGTVGGELTRRYHGLLISAHPAPAGRVLTLVELHATIELDGDDARRLAGHSMPAGAAPSARVERFELDHGLPSWTFEAGGRTEFAGAWPWFMAGTPCPWSTPSWKGTPWRSCSDPSSSRGPRRPGRPDPRDDGGAGRGRWTRHPRGPLPTTRLRFPDECAPRGGAPHLQLDPVRLEADRGYPSEGSLWSPGTLGTRLEPGQPLTIIASTEPAADVPEPRHATVQGAEIERRGALLARATATADPVHGRLVLAADSFIFEPVSRDHERSAKSVIAGYHWFTDWGRDTMISLEGLTLATGRGDEAAAILRTFASRVRDGLIPNLFPRATARASTTPPTPPSGSSTPSTATSKPRTTPTSSTSSSPPCATSSITTSGDTLRDRRRPGRRPAAAGGRGLPADLDGRQGRRLGGHAPTRQGRGDQRPLVQRPPPPRRLAPGNGSRRGRRARSSGGPDPGRRSTIGSGITTAATSTT